MKKPILFSYSILLILAVAGCATIGPLSLRHYRRNVIIGKDRIIRIENEAVDFYNLRNELVGRMITETTPITVHIHEDVSPQVFDTVVKKLRSEGFRKLDFVVYGD